jgi:hypothetical protein
VEVEREAEVEVKVEVEREVELEGTKKTKKGRKRTADILQDRGEEPCVHSVRRVLHISWVEGRKEERKEGRKDQR